MRTGAPDALPLFRSEFQVKLLGLLVLQPERAWTIPEMAERCDAPISSVHRELGRAEQAGIIERDTASRPHTFRAAEESPLYGPLAELLELALGAEEKPAARPTESRDVETAPDPLAELVGRLLQTLRPRVCQRVVGAFMPHRVVPGILRRARRLATLLS